MWARTMLRQCEQKMTQKILNKKIHMNETIKTRNGRRCSEQTSMKHRLLKYKRRFLDPSGSAGVPRLYGSTLICRLSGSNINF